MSRRAGEQRMVPDAPFTSYYGRAVLKAAPWNSDIPAYLFFGGLAAGSSMLGAGADLTGRPSLRRPARLGALGAVTASLAALIHDLGRPSRFLNMLRVAKPTSPMSMGTWLLAGYGPMAGLAAVPELLQLTRASQWLPPSARAAAGLVQRAGRPAGVAAGAIAPAVASYTAVLLADTATPTWHASRRLLPFVFVGSSAAASGGLGLLTATPEDAEPARRMGVGGAVLDLAAAAAMERSIGLAAEPLHEGTAGRLMKAAKALTGVGALAAIAGRRNRTASALSGVALLAGSVCTRFGIFHAGQASARDPKFTVVPQRARVDERHDARPEPRPESAN